jgi:hypothetical protein
LFIVTFPNVNTSRYESLNLTNDGFMSFKKVEDLSSMQRRAVKTIERKLKRVGVDLSEEVITGVVEEEGFADDILQVLVDLQNETSVFSDVTVEIHSRAIYDEILEAATNATLVGSYGMEYEAMVNTKYKTVAKKVKPVATQLPPDTNDHVQQAGKEPRVREARKIGHKFTEETMAKLKIGGGDFLNEQEKKMFRDMLSKHGKAFASSPDEIGCVQPSMVVPMVIFTVPHIPWDLKPIPVSRALLPKLVNLLKEKM